MRDLLWGCDEYLGRDASFPALRGNLVTLATGLSESR